MKKRPTDPTVHDADFNDVYRTVTRFYFWPISLWADNPTRWERRWGLQRVRQVRKWYYGDERLRHDSPQYWHTVIWAD